MLHIDTQSRSKASVSQSRFRSAASYDISSALRRSKNLSTPAQRERDGLLLELLKEFPLGHSRLFHKTELSKFESFLKAKDLQAARAVAANTLAAFQAELTAFFESLFSSFPTKGDDYKRIMDAWHLYVVLLPLTRDPSDPAPAVPSRPSLTRSESSHYAERKSKTASEFKLPSCDELKRNFRLQDSLEQLHRLLRPLICTICHSRVAVWTFLEHTNVCYEYEMGKRSLLSVNKDLLKLCEETQTEALKLNVRMLPETELELENELFGRSRADSLVLNYKKSCASDHSNKSNVVSPEKNFPKETFLGDAFEVHRLDSPQPARGARPFPREMDKGQLWGLQARNPNFLRAMAHANEIRMGLSKPPESDVSKDRSTVRDSLDSKSDPLRASSSRGSDHPSADRNNRKTGLANPEMVRISSNGSLSKQDGNEEEGDLVGDAFFANEEAGSSGKNSLEKSAGETPSISRHSTDKPEPEARANDFRPPNSPKRMREIHYPVLGVIDEEEENLASKRQISPVIMFQENKIQLTQATSDKIDDRKVLESSPSISPDPAPPSPSYKDVLDEEAGLRKSSKVLGLGLDSSTRFISQPTAFNALEASDISADIKPPGSPTASFNIFRRQSGSKKSGNSNKGAQSCENVAVELISPKASSAPESPFMDSERPTDIREGSSNRNASFSSFKKSFRGFQQAVSGESGLYFQPKQLPECPGSEDDPCGPEKRANASKSPLRKKSLTTSTMYAKKKEETDVFGIWSNISPPVGPSDTKESTPEGPDSPSPPKSVNCVSTENPFESRASRGTPSPVNNPFSFRNSLSSRAKAPESDTQSFSRLTNQSSVQKSAFAESIHYNNALANFPGCRTEWRPVRPRECKPLERKDVPFEVRRNIWVEANKAATEYRKPKSKNAANQDHLTYILNKRVQEFKGSLLSISGMANNKAEKDLIFDLNLIKERFQREYVRRLVDRLVEALKLRIELIEQQHKKHSLIGDLEKDFQSRRTFRNRISVSVTNLRTLESHPRRQHKALTALNFEIVDGKVTKKKSSRDSPQPPMLLHKLLKMEESSRNVVPQKKSLPKPKSKGLGLGESKSDAEQSHTKANRLLDTSLGDELSELSSASKDDKTDDFLEVPPGDILLHKKKAPETGQNFRPNESSIERLLPQNRERRGLKRHPSDSKILETAEREKLYFEMNKDVGLDHFEFLKEIGKGAYGKVYLATHKPTREIYALKIIQFQEEVSKKFLEEMQNEISILNVIEGEFLAKAYFSFIDRHCLCIAMEYLVGGDFRSILDSEVRLEPRVAQWYIAQLCMAVQELHSWNIVHRDLKPENILLDKDLKLKLADFGLSEFRKRAEVNLQVSDENVVDPRLKNPAPKTKERRLVGTPDYIPPEVLLAVQAPSERHALEDNDDSGSKGKKSPKERKDDREPSLNASTTGSRMASGLLARPVPDEPACKESGSRRGLPVTEPQFDELSSAIDWWGVGCLLYEFLVGVSPFGGLTLDEVWRNIRTFNIVWPEIGYGEDCITPEAQDLILRFLDRDPQKRIGVKSFQDIQDHPFFRGLDWSRLSTDPAPFSLEVKLPTVHKNIKVSMVVPRKPPSMPTYRFDAQELVISRLDLFYELNIKRVLETRDQHGKLLSGHMQLLDGPSGSPEPREASLRHYSNSPHL